MVTYNIIKNINQTNKNYSKNKSHIGLLKNVYWYYINREVSNFDIKSQNKFVLIYIGWDFVQ